MIKLEGYFNGTKWDKDSKKFSIQRLGTPESGAILCGLSVTSKDKDGTKVYGKPVDVKINIKDANEAKRVYGLIASGESMCVCDGFFIANNYTKDDKEVKGNQFLVTDSTTFKKYDGASKPKADDKSDDKEWDIF
jgi:hypothetical protein